MIAAWPMPALAPGEHAVVQIAHHERRAIRCRRGAIEAASHHAGAQGHATVWTAGHRGVVTGPCDEPAALARLVADARALARVPATPPPPDADAGTASPGDAELTAATTGELANRVRALLAQIAARSGELVVETCEIVAETTALAAWRTADAAWRRDADDQRTRLAWAVSLMRTRGAGATALFEVIGCDASWQRGWARLSAEVDALAARLAHASSRDALPLGNRVLLSPTAVADLVLPHLIIQHHAGAPTALALATEPDDPGFFREPLGIAAGRLDDRALRSTLGEVLCLGRFIGNVDPTSGRFSGVAKCSWLLAPGQPDALVPEVAVSGSLPVLLASLADATATRELVRGEVVCPGLLVGEGLAYGAVPRRHVTNRSELP